MDTDRRLSMEIEGPPSCMAGHGKVARCALTERGIEVPLESGPAEVTVGPGQTLVCRTGTDGCTILDGSIFVSQKDGSWAKVTDHGMEPAREGDVPAMCDGGPNHDDAHAHYHHDVIAMTRLDGDAGMAMLRQHGDSIAATDASAYSGLVMGQLDIVTPEGHAELYETDGANASFFRSAFPAMSETIFDADGWFVLTTDRPYVYPYSFPPHDARGEEMHGIVAQEYSSIRDAIARIGWASLPASALPRYEAIGRHHGLMCASGLEWSIDDAGTLTLSPIGIDVDEGKSHGCVMTPALIEAPFNARDGKRCGDWPWRPYADEIRRVRIPDPDGVIVCNMDGMFDGCANLTDVGDLALLRCDDYGPARASYFRAFGGCDKLLSKAGKDVRGYPPRVWQAHEGQAAAFLAYIGEHANKKAFGEMASGAPSDADALGRAVLEVARGDIEKAASAYADALARIDPDVPKRAPRRDDADAAAGYSEDVARADGLLDLRAEFIEAQRRFKEAEALYWTDTIHDRRFLDAEQEFHPVRRRFREAKARFKKDPILNLRVRETPGSVVDFDALEQGAREAAPSRAPRRLADYDGPDDECAGLEEDGIGITG